LERKNNFILIKICHSYPLYLSAIIIYLFSVHVHESVYHPFSIFADYSLYHPDDAFHVMNYPTA